MKHRAVKVGGTATGSSRLETAGRDGLLVAQGSESSKPIAVLQKGVGLCARVIYKPSYIAHASRDN